MQHINIAWLPFFSCGTSDETCILYLLYIAIDTWRKDVKSGDIKHAINEAAPDKLKPLHVSEVPFHPFADFINALDIYAASDVCIP